MNKKYIFLGITVVIFIAGFWLRGQIQIDTCLDKGGKWDYEKKECISANLTSPTLKPTQSLK